MMIHVSAGNLRPSHRRVGKAQAAAIPPRAATQAWHAPYPVARTQTERQQQGRTTGDPARCDPATTVACPQPSHMHVANESQMYG